MQASAVKKELEHEALPVPTAAEQQKTAVNGLSPADCAETLRGVEVKHEHQVEGAAAQEQVTKANLADGAPALSKMDKGTGLSEYEQMREANIRRNNALLESLDIPTAALAIPERCAGSSASAKKTEKKRKPLLALDPFMEPRRSGRRLALAEEKEQLLVALPDSWDENDERKTAHARKSPPVTQAIEVDVCGSVMQCIAVCCSVLQCAAVCCSVLLCAAVYCVVSQCAAVCCSVLQCAAVCCSVLQCAAVCYSVLQ